MTILNVLIGCVCIIVLNCRSIVKLKNNVCVKIFYTCIQICAVIFFSICLLTTNNLLLIIHIKIPPMKKYISKLNSSPP